MKKSRIATAIAAAVLSVSLLGAVGGCKVRQPYEFEYEVYVVGGTGGGTYKDGADCSVTAEIPEGKKFEKWVNEYGEVLSVSNPYTFKVDGDTEVYAVVSNVDTFRVEIVGGTITGTSDYDVNVYAGSNVSVTAKSTNSRKFKEWLINGEEKSTDNPYVFTAEKDMKIEALFDESYLIAVSGGTIGDGGDTRRIYESGAECTINAGEAPAGLSFGYWYVNDEDGNEKILTFEESYTFTVTGTDKYYAKFGNMHAVTVENGYFELYPEYKTIKVLDGGSVTVALDTENVPLNKGFNGWSVGDEIKSKDMTYRITGVTGDLTVTADLQDKVSIETPKMDSNQILRKRMQGGNENDYVLEIDRSGVTVFTDDTEYAAIYIYDNPYAEKSEWVGMMKIDAEGGAWRLATRQGEKLWFIEGAPGNFWLESKDGFNQGKGTRGNAMEMFKKAIESCGNTYSETTPYYLSAQVVAKRFSLSGDSEISVIGPQAFCQSDLTKHTVNVEGGAIKGTNLSQVTMYKGQIITVVSEEENFNFWLVNGEIVRGNPCEITVTENLTVSAVVGTSFNLTLVGGAFKDGSSTIEATPGETYTAVAEASDDPNKCFAYWYCSDGDNEVIVSYDEEFSFVAVKDVTYYAKYEYKYTLTLTGGILNGDRELTGEIEVLGGVEYTITPDLTLIPEGKRFVGWKIGEEVIEQREYKLRFTADMVIAAQYGDKFQLDAPEMSDNQMIKHNDNYLLEFDRGKNDDGSKKSAFNENVDYVKFYIYTDVNADKEDYVGAFKLERDGAFFKLSTMDGEKLWGIEGSAGNMWLDTKDNYASDRKGNFFGMLQKVLGENYDETATYYFAAQTVVKESSRGDYLDSEISVIGPQVFQCKVPEATE